MDGAAPTAAPTRLVPSGIWGPTRADISPMLTRCLGSTENKSNFHTNFLKCITFWFYSNRQMRLCGTSFPACLQNRRCCLNHHLQGKWVKGRFNLTNFSCVSCVHKSGVCSKRELDRRSQHSLQEDDKMGKERAEGSHSMGRINICGQVGEGRCTCYHWAGIWGGGKHVIKYAGLHS